MCYIHDRCEAAEGVDVGAGTFVEVERIFARISSNLPKMFSVGLCLQTFSYKDREDIFWCDIQTGVFYGKRWAPFLESKKLDNFFPNFQGFRSDFHKVINFWGSLAPCATLPYTPLVGVPSRLDFQPQIYNMLYLIHTINKKSKCRFILTVLCTSQKTYNDNDNAMLTSNNHCSIGVTVH